LLSLIAVAERCLLKGKGLRRSEGLSFRNNLLRAQEEQHEGEQNQRFNESQSNE
jgi:hypothetical protein